MALLGPMVVVTETSAAELIDVLSKAGAFPIVETGWADVPTAITEVQPVAVVIAPAADAVERHVRALARSIETRAGPVTPVFALVQNGDTPSVSSALASAPEDDPERFIARLNSALRIRTLHATVLRRARAMNPARLISVPGNLLADATVLCVGRGGSYPALSVALGERVSLIGAFSIETAARCLNARDFDGIVIGGEGLGLRPVDALLTALAEDPRFRDLPIGLLNRSADEDRALPNLMSVEANALRLVERILPFVRLRALEAHLKRTLKSLESDGFLDPDTGLLESQAFWRDLDRAVGEAEESGSALSIARFSFEGITDGRSHIDAARLFSRLVRTVDFACREQDGSILAAFTGTDLRSAHVVARRIASTLKQTMLSPGRDRRTIRPSITLATFKPTDNLSTLVARVGAYPKAHAGQ